MNQTRTELAAPATEDIATALESAHTPHSDELVTLTLTLLPDRYGQAAAADIRRLWPQAKEIIETSKTSRNGKPVVSEVRRFVCNYPTITEARDAFDQKQPYASVRIEAAIPLLEEEFEVLAQYHAHRVQCGRSSVWERAEHNARLNDIADVLGKEAVRHIVENVWKPASRRVATDGPADVDPGEGATP